MKTYRLTSAPPAEKFCFADELNPEQRAVVTAGDGPTLVIAGAGSGKTRTLIYRVAYLLERGVQPAQIALCTFTNKAAREMLQRVDQLVGPQGALVCGGTFHHLANQLVRTRASELGLAPGYSIMDQQDAQELLGLCASERERQGGGPRKLLPRAQVLLSLLSYATNVKRPLSEVVLHKSPSLHPVLDEVVAIAEEYARRKRLMEALDFDDLLVALCGLLQHPTLGPEISDRFTHVLVDEYQDTNALQGDIVDLLARAHGNLTVVGDDAQSIYGFRGASPNNMGTFLTRWPGARVYKLETNYRSTPEILCAANAAIRHNPEQLPKELRAVRPSGALPALVAVRDVRVQAGFVAQRVTELVDQGIPLDEMAVLYRAHSHSLELQVELTRRRIPFRVRSGLRFFEQAHIKDVLAHLRVVENPLDELSWLRVSKLQPGVGKGLAAQLWRRIQGANEPLQAFLEASFAAQVAPRSRPGITRLQWVLRKLTAPEHRKSASLSIQAIMESGYRELLPSLYDDPRTREEDIEQLSRYADTFPGTQEFLSELHLLSGFTTEEVLGSRKDEEALVLSTIHQAKGLEWRAVFLLALNEGVFPHPWALTESGNDQEERRLFYVALTRAKDELYLVHWLVSDRPRDYRILVRPSRFIEEIEPAGCLERWNVEG